jgi:hypothetical protein
VVILAILMQIIFGKIREITKRKNTFKKKTKPVQHLQIIALFIAFDIYILPAGWSRF